MKTYKKTIIKNCLVIEYDDDPISPREDDNLGYFITIDRNHESPDNNEELKTIIKNTGENAENQKEHIKLIKKEIEELRDEKVIAIYPITKYEHSGISYSLGSCDGFDYSNNGFYIITNKTQEWSYLPFLIKGDTKEMGAKKKNFKEIIKNEFKHYNQYLNGEIYRFCLYDQNGELKDACGNFYNIEDIKEHLPKEYKNDDMSNYLQD